MAGDEIRTFKKDLDRLASFRLQGERGEAITSEAIDRQMSQSTREGREVSPLSGDPVDTGSLDSSKLPKVQPNWTRKLGVPPKKSGSDRM